MGVWYPVFAAIALIIVVLLLISFALLGRGPGPRLGPVNAPPPQANAPGAQAPGAAANPAAQTAATAGARPAGYIPLYRIDKHVHKFSKGNPKIALFVAWTILLYVAAISLHPEAAFLVSLKWFGILLLLLAMVVILCIGADLLKKSWLTLLVFALLTVAVIDPGLIRNFPEEFKSLYHSAGGDSCPAKAPTSGETLGNEWREFNPGGCDSDIVVTSGVILMDGPGLTTPVRLPTNNGRPDLGDRVYTRIRADTPNAVVWIMLCPPGKRIIGEWKCHS